jgi:hypothetical protein
MMNMYVLFVDFLVWDGQDVYQRELQTKSKDGMGVCNVL